MISLLVVVLLTAPDAGVLKSRPVTIEAPHAELFNKESRGIYTGGVKVLRDAMTMTCDQLEIFYSGQDVDRLVAKGNVYAIEADKEVWGDEAEYLNRTGVLTVKGKPRGKQGAREIDGDLVTFTTGIDRLIVHKARTRVKEPQDKRVAIDADLLTLEGPQNEATWTGHVRATKGKMTLTAPELTAYYNDAGDVTRAKARGGVEVVEEDRWARGQFADYDVPTGVLVVTGKPQARDAKTRMKGTKVTFYSGTEFLEVENATTVVQGEKKKVVP